MVPILRETFVLKDDLIESATSTLCNIYEQHQKRHSNFGRNGRMHSPQMKKIKSVTKTNSKTANKLQRQSVNIDSAGNFTKGVD